MVSLRDILYPPITLATFEALRASDPKRICFGSTHRNALKRSSGSRSAGFFNVPFVETIGSVFPWELFRNTKGQYGGYFRTVSDDLEYNDINSWMTNNADVVFIRSLFKTAVAACEHYISPDKRSEIGELEHSAKYDGNAESADKLIDILTEIYQRMHSGRRIDAIISVPPSVVGTTSLPNYIAAKLAARLNLEDLTAELRWEAKKPSIKELDVNAKWGALEAVGLSVSAAVEGKNLLLIDDMYQSGTTAHFVASRLRGAAANDLHLLAVSKGRRDTDNK